MAGAVARTEFNQALKAIATERGLDSDVILQTIREAYVAAYRRDAKDRGENTDGFDYEAEIDPMTGEAKIFGWEVDEEGTATGERKNVTPPGFGRIAAQTAKQVIHQKIREAEKGIMMDEYEGRVGSLVSGIVLRFDGSSVRVDLGKSEALMPAEERVPSERLNPSQRLTFLLKEIIDTPRGKQMILSRIDPEFILKVFAREVPEIASGSVEIKGVARDPGIRTKIAVYSSQPGVDPVGSCVGQKGVRVQSVTNELGGERVDVIPWTEDAQEFIKGTLAPVNVISVEINKEEETAKVTVPSSELSLAIGKDGQNVRLASRLTGFRIEVEGDGTETAAPEITNDEQQETNQVEEKTEEVQDQVQENLEPVVEEKIEENQVEEEKTETVPAE